MNIFATSVIEDGIVQAYFDMLLPMFLAGLIFWGVKQLPKYGKIYRGLYFYVALLFAFLLLMPWLILKGLQNLEGLISHEYHLFVGMTIFMGVGTSLIGLIAGSLDPYVKEETARKLKAQDAAEAAKKEAG